MKELIKKVIQAILPFETNRKKLSRLIQSGLLTVGDYTYQWQSIKIDTYLGSEANVKIGKFCSISKNVRIITGGIHPTNWVSTFPFRSHFNLPGKYKDGIPSTNGDIIIGNDVWIGTGVTILSGVTIGDGAIVAAGALVSKNISEYSIAGGVPAKVIRNRFTMEQIEKLKEIKWWDWNEERILESINLLSSNKIDEFISKQG